MYNTLKPTYFFRSFRIYGDPTPRDIYAAIKNCVEGDMHEKDYTTSYLAKKLWSGSSSKCYDRMPRCFKYYSSEAYFNELLFSFEFFYDSATPTEVIFVDYYNHLKSRIGDNTSKLENEFKKIKKNNPELFI